jgi:hypothetical protein
MPACIHPPVHPSKKKKKKLTHLLSPLHRCVVLAAIGTIDVDLPGMGVTRVGVTSPESGAMHCTLVIHDAAAIWRMLIYNDIGFGTGYCDGLWSTNNLTTCVTVSSQVKCFAFFLPFNLFSLFIFFFCIFFWFRLSY